MKLFCGVFSRDWERVYDDTEFGLRKGGSTIHRS